jgi:hypothetical protein
MKTLIIQTFFSLSLSLSLSLSFPLSLSLVFLDNDTSMLSAALSRLRWTPSVPKQGARLGDQEDLPLRTVQFGCSFLLNVVLHCRERAGMRAWVTVLRQAFQSFPHTALWFVKNLLSPDCSWLDDFLMRCSDPLARGTFVQLVVQAASVVAPTDPQSLISFVSLTEPELVAACQSEQSNCEAYTALLVREIMDKVLLVPMCIRVADELFVLIRDLAAIPCACQAMLQCNAISRLAFFAIPDGVPLKVKAMFASRMSSTLRLPGKNDFCMLLQSVFEAMAALLGVPQMRKVQLLQEKTYWETELVAEAKVRVSG